MTTYRQASFFDAPTSPTSLAQERAARDAGIDQATGASSPIWRELAYQALVELARRQPTVFVDELYAVLERPNDGRPNANAYLWIRARREGIITPTGEVRPTALPGKHAHPYPVYRSLVYGQAPETEQEADYA